MFVINETKILSQCVFHATDHLPPSFVMGKLLFGGWDRCGSCPDKDVPKCSMSECLELHGKGSVW